MLTVDFDAGAVNATAYAARRPDGNVLVAIVNKDALQKLTCRLPAWRVDKVLAAPSLAAKDAHILTGQAVTALISGWERL